MRGLFIRQPIFCSRPANNGRGSIERSDAWRKRWVQTPGGQSWQKGEKRRKLCAIDDIQIQGYSAPGRYPHGNTALPPPHNIHTEFQWGGSLSWLFCLLVVLCCPDRSPHTKIDGDSRIISLGSSEWQATHFVLFRHPLTAQLSFLWSSSLWLMSNFRLLNRESALIILSLFQTLILSCGLWLVIPNPPHLHLLSPHSRHTWNAILGQAGIKKVAIGNQHFHQLLI